MSMDIGQNAFSAKIQALKAAMVAESVKAVDNTCKNISTYAKITHGLQGGNPTRPNKTVFESHTYNLEDSIHEDVPTINGGIVKSAVRATMPYAADVEYGTSTSRPYPFLKPSVEASSKELPIQLGIAWDKARTVVK